MKVFCVVGDWSHWIKNIFLCIFSVFIFQGVTLGFGEPASIFPQTKKVLIVSSYSLDYPAYDLFAKQVKQRFNQETNVVLQVFHESLENLQFSSDERMLEGFANALKQKYAGNGPDVIIVDGEPATHFMKRYGPMIFDQIPTILVAYAYFQEKGEYQNLPNNYTVLAPKMADTDEPLQVILNLKPKTKKIYIILGNSRMEQNVLQNTSQQFADITKRAEIIYLNQFTYSDLLEYIKKIDGDEAAIFFVTFQQDNRGVGYVSADVLKEICQVSRVPVFGLLETYMESGCIGGYTFSTTAIAGKVAEKVLNSLRGQQPDSQVEVTDAGAYLFDWEALQRWKINEETLPEGSIVLHRQPNFLFLYRWYILGGVLLFALQTILIVALVINAEKRRRAERELMRLDRMNIVGEMAASIGHEIRNPLTTIRGYLQIFRQKENFREYVQQFNVMLEELDRANAIITEFLSLANNKRLEIKLGDLNMTIQAMLPLLKAEAFPYGVEVCAELSKIPRLNYDDQEISKLLLNLARNAFDAMEEGGILTIKTGRENNWITLIIEDSGNGIPKEVLKKLGTPFVTTKDHGVGLGLPICYRVADRHKAQIEIRTGSAGTSFTFRFPIPV